MTTNLWAHENESASSTISSSSSSNSKEPEHRINVMAARQRIVDRIMEKKRNEARERAQQRQQTSRDDGFIRPSPGLSTNNSISGERSMELTRVASTTPGKKDRSARRKMPPQGATVYRSTPLPGRDAAEQSALPLFSPLDDDVVPEIVESEEESPPQSHARSHERPSARSPRRAPADRSAAEQSIIKPSEGQSPHHVPLDTGRAVETDAAPRPSTRYQRHRSGRNAQKAPSIGLIAKVGRSKSPKAQGKRPSTAKKREIPEEVSRSRAATTSQQQTPERSAQKAPAKNSQANQSIVSSSSRAPLATSRIGGSARRKNIPKKITPQNKWRKTFAEIERLQNATGYLLPRLPFMRVVREISAQVSTIGESYRFTVDAMEAIQTAAEFYVSNVFADAFRLAIHAKRVTVMPKDLDMLRTLKIIDS